MSLHFAFAQGQLITDSIFSQALDQYEYYQVYLPENYDPDNQDGYQSIYFLHGSLNNHTSYGYLIPILDSLIANGIMAPTIVVKPNGSQGPYGGSMYVNSVLNGNVEDFIIQDLIPYIDENFNTKKDRQYRTIMGHSMGANGAGRLALSYPELFIGFGAHSGTPDINLFDIFFDWVIFNAFPTSIPPYTFAPGGWQSFFFIASSGWSPNLENQPYQVDLPVDEFGFPIDSILQVWSQFTEAQIVSQNPDIGDLAIFFDCGIQDQFQFFPVNEGFRDTLVKYNISHIFEYYEGGHSDKLAERFPRSLEFLDSVMNAKITDVLEINLQIEEMNLYPNPSNRALNIQFQLKKSMKMSIDLLSLEGKKIRSLITDSKISEGQHKLSFELENLPGGQYFINFLFNGQNFSKKWSVY